MPAPDPSPEPIAAPLPGLGRLLFRAVGLAGGGSALLLPLLAATLYAEEPRIVFDNRPESGIPREARLQEMVDTQSHGTLAKVLGDSVQLVSVRYFSSEWSEKKQVSAYLTGLLADQRTEAYTFQIWSQGVGEPEIECLLTFKNHKQGRLLLWGTTACVRDDAGKWWFVSAFDYFHRKHPKGDRSLAKTAPIQP
jgi:hypothetical protein